MNITALIPPRAWGFKGETHLYGIAKAMERGHAVSYLGSGDVVERPSDFPIPDLVFMSDPREKESSWWKVAHYKCPKVVVFGDTWHDYANHVYWAADQGIRFIAVRARGDIPKIQSMLGSSAKAFWLPYAFLPEVFNSLSTVAEQKICDVAQFGHLGWPYPVRERAREVLSWQTEFVYRDAMVAGDQETSLRGEAYAKALSSARIVVEAGGHLNWLVSKHFEIPACGALLLANQGTAHGFQEIFEDGKTCRLFRDDCSDLLDVIRETLACPAMSAAIAGRGYNLVHHEHTEYNRLATLLKEVGLG